MIEASEQSILSSIIQILGYRRISVVHIRNTGSIGTRDGRPFFMRSRFDQRGAPDLMFSYRGIACACEVKSRKGRLRPEQRDWLQKWMAPPAYGYAFVARSVDDVLNQLELLDACVPQTPTVKPKLL